MGCVLGAQHIAKIFSNSSWGLYPYYRVFITRTITWSLLQRPSNPRQLNQVPTPRHHRRPRMQTVPGLSKKSTPSKNSASRWKKRACWSGGGKLWNSRADTYFLSPLEEGDIQFTSCLLHAADTKSAIVISLSLLLIPAISDQRVRLNAIALKGEDTLCRGAPR